MAEAVETNEARIAGRRNPAILLTLFVAIFGLQILIALLGYRYIGLASEYLARNLEHLDTVTRAQVELEAAAIGVDFPVETLTTLVSEAKDHAVWCIETLGPFERHMISWIGANAAIDICTIDIERAIFALSLLEKLGAPPDPNAGLTERPFALAAQLGQTLRLMSQDSRDFAPQVIAIREKITYTVSTGTTVAGVFMLMLLLILSRTFLANWKSLSIQATEILQQSNRFKLAMQSNVDGLALFDSQRRLINVNENFVSLFSLERSPVRGDELTDLLQEAIANGGMVDFSGDANDLLSQINDMMESAHGNGFQVSLKHDRYAVLSLSETGFGDVLLLVKDITVHVLSDREKEAHAQEMQLINAQIEAHAKEDPLTKLTNRRGLDDALKDRLGDANKTIIRIDLDRFKQVNDVFGHEAGDHVLVHVSTLLRELCRQQDIPVRVGGDEFLILCEPGTDAQKAIAFSNRLLEKIQEPVRYKGKQLLFGASFGVASSNDLDDDFDSLLRSADAALYLAKKSGRSTVRLFTPDLREAVQRDRALAEAVLPALYSGQFKAFGQSIHRADDWSVAGIEILARWQHPEFGLLTPNEFLHVIRELGMEADLDEAIFSMALSNVRDIEKSGFVFPRVSFNVSAGRLLDPRFLDTVDASQEHWEGRIAFEILETISLDEGTAILPQLKQLKSQGIEVDVDDFGSGHASINSVIDIGPSTLKIDRKIIKALGDNDSAKTVVSAIIEMGKAMDVRITAEGVETVEQAQIIRDLGGDHLQGYFFSQPMPLEDLVVHLQTMEAKKPSILVADAQDEPQPTLRQTG